MKNIFSLFFLLIVVSFIYISFAYVFNINRIFLPDFWILIVLFISFYYGESSKLTLVFLIGLLKDLFEIGPFGSNAFLFFFIAFFIKDILHFIDRENIWNIFASIFLISLIYYFFKYFIYLLFDYDVLFSFLYFWKSIINSLVAPFIFSILLKTKNWTIDVAK